MKKIALGVFVGWVITSIYWGLDVARLKEAHRKSCFTDVAAHHYFDCLKALQ